jgi:hypothetical protein
MNAIKDMYMKSDWMCRGVGLLGNLKGILNYQRQWYRKSFIHGYKIQRNTLDSIYKALHHTPFIRVLVD